MTGVQTCGLPIAIIFKIVCPIIITGKSKELVNGNDYGTYNLEDDSFKDKDLSVVIIFSNGKEKFAFAIDLKTREVGDYYG